MTLFNLNNLLKSLSSDVVVLGVRASIYESGRYTIQPITHKIDCLWSVSVYVFMYSFTGEVLKL